MLQSALNNAWVHQVLYKPFDHNLVQTTVERLLLESDQASQLGSEDYEVKSWLLVDDGETGLDDYEEATPSHDSESSKELILVIDDLGDMRNLISRSLENKDYRVVKASNGRRGLELAKKMRPDLIVTDWMMTKTA